MLRLNTVFVLGAALSSEMGLPLGNGLKNKILDLLPPEHARSGDEAFEFLRRNRPDVGPSIAALRNALPLAASIDNLVQHRGHDRQFVTVAKWGIARAIALAEQSSLLRHDQAEDQPLMPYGNSYEALFHLIVAGVGIESLPAAFGRLRVVTFNYDRTLEVYLHRAIQAYSGIGADRAADILRRAEIIHAYGALGADNEGSTRTLEFRPDSSPGRIELDAAGLRTFSEKEDSASVNVIRGMVAGAERLIFLGCAFHDQNLRLIQPQLNQLQAVYATAYSPPPPDQFAQPAFDRFSLKQADPMRNAIRRWPAQQNHIHVDDRIAFQIEAMTCRQLITMYGSEWRE